MRPTPRNDCCSSRIRRFTTHDSIGVVRADPQETRARQRLSGRVLPLYARSRGTRKFLTNMPPVSGKITGVPVEEGKLRSRQRGDLEEVRCRLVFHHRQSAQRAEEVKDLVASVKAGGTVAERIAAPIPSIRTRIAPGKRATAINRLFRRPSLASEDQDQGRRSKTCRRPELQGWRRNHRRDLPVPPNLYSRGKLHIILSVDNSSIDVTKGKRKTMTTRSPGARISTRVERFTRRWAIAKRSLE